MSHRDLSVALKAMASREVRESSKIASATVAARLKGQNSERSSRVAHAHRKEQLRVAQLRATRRESIYGDAVKEANMRSGNGGKRKKAKTRESPGPWR